MSKVQIYNQQGKKLETLELDKKVFDGKVNNTLMQQAVVTFLANQRKGLASTKKRGEVRGGSSKPWAQKGTGRARVGSLRSPLWRSGGITFGPKPRDYSKKMPKRMRILALKSALNVKLKENQILIIDDLKLESPKTKEIARIINKLKLTGQRIMLVVERMEKNLKLASGNLSKFNLDKAAQLHTYGALNCKKLLFTSGALKVVEKRIKKWLS